MSYILGKILSIPFVIIGTVCVFIPRIICTSIANIHDCSKAEAIYYNTPDEYISIENAPYLLHPNDACYNNFAPKLMELIETEDFPDGEIVYLFKIIRKSDSSIVYRGYTKNGQEIIRRLVIT